MNSSSVAFDEDFEAELAENYDARLEVSLLAKSPDFELTEVRSFCSRKFSLCAMFEFYSSLMTFSLNSIKPNFQRLTARNWDFNLVVWLVILKA